MPLMQLSDFQAPARLDAGMNVALAAQFRILATAPARLMPPLNSTAPLVMNQKVLLIQWLSTFSSFGELSCAITESDSEHLVP